MISDKNNKKYHLRYFEANNKIASGHKVRKF